VGQEGCSTHKNYLCYDLRELALFKRGHAGRDV